MPGFLNRLSTDASHRSTVGLTAVGALGCQIVVRTATPAGTRAVESLFRSLREPLRPDILASLALRRRRTDWIVSGGTDAEVVYGPLPHARWELRDRVTRLLMNARPDLLWLHAAGVARDGHAILITGPSGSGKSILATRLIADGFAYLGDDALPLDPRTKMVYPFPVTPAVRRGASQFLLAADAQKLRKRDVVVRPAQIATGPLPVAGIVFPRFAPGPCLLQPVSPGRVALDLLRQCRDFGRHREDAVRVMSLLAGAVPAWTLSYVDPGEGAEAIAGAYAAGGVGSISAAPGREVTWG